MANDTRSSRRAKDEENNNGRMKRIGEKGPINSCLNVSDTTGPRRSPRDISSKKMTPSPSSTRKSERLEKRTLPTLTVRRKSERVETQKMPSPLRRSGRTKNNSPLNPSNSKSSGSLSSKQKSKKEKSVKQLTFETKEVSENEEHGVETSQLKVKRMDARMYRSLFRKPNKVAGMSDCCEELHAMEKSTPEGSNNGVGKIDDCLNTNHSNCEEVSKNGMLTSEDAKAKEMRGDSRSSEPVKEQLEDNVTLGSLVPTNVTTYETRVAPERVQPDCCREENRNNDVHDRGEELIPSKRKGAVVDMDSDVPVTLANDDSCNLTADMGLSRLGGSIVGTSGPCSKRIRLDQDPTSCNPSATRLPDGGDIEERMPQKECPANLQTDIAKNAYLVCNNEGQLLSDSFRSKFDSFRFVEYWVPVQISYVQLEQYCATLLSKASILRSSSKIDTFDALRDVLISIRKCCSHPYVADPSVPNLLSEGLQEIEYLDFGIKASGKLQLLDSMLMELRKKGLRVVVLFQSIGGSGRTSIGDILDDFVRQRFGPDLYERIDKALSLSKKQAALKIFNNKDNGRFVFLLETGACLPSIKLSSVDAVIIFDSDWNPMNDIRSLQKITLDSQFGWIKIFRLYTSFTVEEKALILAKQDKALDINLQNISRSTTHMLLMWGASYLFDELKAFHDGETSGSSLQLLKEVVNEFSSIVSQDGEDNHSSNCSNLLKVQHNGATYRADFSLLGELKLGLLDGEPSHIFWTKLLEGKRFQWKYSCSSSQRSRKRVNHFGGSVDRPDLEIECIAKKRRKVSNNVVDQSSTKSEGEKSSTGNKAGKSEVPMDRPQGDESEKRRKLRDEQRSLHLLLKPEIAKLCEVLLLPDNVKSMVDNFLEYVVNNHHVSRESVAMLQAFQISLCWTAASLLKHKLDHKDSLMLANQYLNFDCKKEEVDYIYSKLRCLKKLFLCRMGKYNVTGSPKASDRIYSRIAEVELAKKDISQSIKKIQKKCQKELEKLRLKQQEEKQKLKATIEDEKANFENGYKTESAVIQSFFPNDVMRKEKLKIFNSQYGKRIEKLKWQHEMRLKDLEAEQSDAMLKYQERKATWVEEVKSWAQTELSNIVDSKELGKGAEYWQTCDQAEPHNCPENVGPLHDHFAKGNIYDNIVEAVTKSETVIGLSVTPETNSSVVVPCSSPVELPTPLVKHAAANEMGIMASEDQSVSRNEGHNIAGNQHESQGNIISKDSHSREQNSDGTTSMTDEGERCENFSHGSCDGCEEGTVRLVLPSTNGELRDGETSDVPSGEVAPETCKTNSSNDGQDAVPSSNGFSDGMNNIASLNSQLPEELTPIVVATCMPNCENAALIHEADHCNGSNDAITAKTSLSDERIADGATVSVLDGEVSVGMPRTVNVTDCPENVAAVNPPLSTEQMCDGGAVNVSVLDRELPRSSGTASPGNSPHTTIHLHPSLEHQNPDGVSSSMSDRQIPLEVPETIHEGASISDREVPLGTDCLENVTPLHPPSSVDQISDGDSVHASVLGNVLSSRPCGAASPGDGPLTISRLNPPSLKLQIPDGGILVVVPENSHEMADCHNDIVHSMNTVLVDRSTTSGLQEGLPRAVAEYTLSQATSIRRQVDVMEPLEPVQQLSSVESPPDQNTSGEMHSSSQQFELVSNPVDIVPVNQSSHVSSIMEPTEQVQQLPSAELPPSNQDSSNLTLATGVERQLINEDAFSCDDTGASTAVTNQDIVQPGSSSELLSHSHQVVQPALNSNLDSVAPGGVRTQSSDTINLSTTAGINNHPIQTATQSASRMFPPLCSDPLKNELERIRKVTEQIAKNHEDMKLRLKLDFEKELEELRKKYDVKFQQIEVEFQHTKNNLDTSFNKVLMSKILADTFRSKCMDLKVSGASRMQQDRGLVQQLLQLSGQQSATRPSLVSGLSSSGPPAAASLWSASTSASSHNLVSPVQAAYNNTTEFLSHVSPRPPHVNYISSPSGNVQAGGDVRVPPPHLQTYRPSTTVLSSTLPGLPHGMPSQSAPSNIPATSPSFSHHPPRPVPTTFQSDTHLGRWPHSAGALPTPNLSAMDLRRIANSQSGINLLNVLSHMSDVASQNLSRSGTSSMQANSTPQATTDVVCLSDDD